MDTIRDNLQQVLSQLPQGVRLVAVSKYHPVEALAEAYAAGQRIFGESHVQELTMKHGLLPDDIRWHFIGHLQTNKVKHIAPFIDMIEAVDSPRLLYEINRQAVRCGRMIRVLLELHIAEEETKYGFTLDGCREYLLSGEWKSFDHVQLCGLMMMASNTDDVQQINSEFQLAEEFFHEVKQRFFAFDDAFCERSWGMSHDFPLAVAHGSTLVRVGTRIFGERVS